VQQIAELFQKDKGHGAKLSFCSSGKLYIADQNIEFENLKQLGNGWKQTFQSVAVDELATGRSTEIVTHFQYGQLTIYMRFGYFPWSGTELVLRTGVSDDLP
jgi:hypothetical protein